MNTNKITIIFLVSILALAGIGISYAGFVDLIQVHGNVSTAYVEIDVEDYSGTDVWKIWGCPDETPDGEIYIWRGFEDDRPNQADIEADYPGCNVEFIASAWASEGDTFDVDMEWFNIFPCINFIADIIVHYEGSIPAKMYWPEIVWLEGDEYFLDYTTIKAYKYSIVNDEWDKGEEITDWPYQVHNCYYVGFEVTINLPQQNTLQEKNGRFSFDIDVIQWNEECEEGPSNNPPIANDDYVSIESGSSNNLIDVLDNDFDPDGDTLTIDTVTGPDHGYASTDGDYVYYTPEDGYGGEDEFDYTISDGKGGTSTASVFINHPQSHSLKIGADNPEYDGQALGYTRESASNYYCYSYYYSYLYKSGSSDYHGYAVFDLEDIVKWDGAVVTNAKLVIHNYYRYYIDTVKFTALYTTPYHNAPSPTSMAVYDESGPTGTQIGEFSAADAVDTSYHTIEIPLNDAGIDAINNALIGTPADYYIFGVGMYVDSIVDGYSYGYLRWTDIRLEVTVEYNEELTPTTPGEGIAFGDDWSGHVYRYTTPSNRPYGYLYCKKSSSYEYRGYAQWGILDIAQAFGQNNFDNIEITKVSLRLNHYTGTSTDIYIYKMDNNVLTATDEEIFNDCGDGTLYTGPLSILSGERSEIEWDLGPDAVSDFQDAFDDNDPDFFGIGLVTTSLNNDIYEFSPRLVIEWEWETPP